MRTVLCARLFFQPSGPSHYLSTYGSRIDLFVLTLKAKPPLLYTRYIHRTHSSS